jgi:ribosomal protein S18 acetylase RimI-like enzyme
LAISFNHTIVHAHDAEGTARFLTQLLRLPPHRRLGHFTVVQIGETSLDFIQTDADISSRHFAFLVSEAEFDEILGQILERNIPFWADPFHNEPGHVNRWDDGRGLFFNDPNGHLLEIMTRPYGSGGFAAQHPNPLLVADVAHELVIRDAVEGDVDRLAQLWFDGWHDAHAEVVPADLRRVRTLASFRERLSAALADVRVAETSEALAGFAMLKGDELYQFYVAAFARGTSVAPSLMADALARLRAAGVATAWLACAIGNERAARFYHKQGWRRAGVTTSRLPTPEAIVELDVWRYEIDLRPTD